MKWVFVLIQRICITVPTLLALTVVLFLMVKAIPGDPAVLLLGDKASPEALAQARKDMGLDKPIYVQYSIYITKLVTERDFGRSTLDKTPINGIVAQKFPATVELAFAAMVFACLFGIPMGFIAALRPSSMLDFTTMSTAVLGVSMPVFWLGLILMWLFGLNLEWFPISGRLASEYMYTYEPETGFIFIDAIRSKDWGLLTSGLHHLVLPAVTLGTIPMAFLARMTRASMLEVLRQDYIRTAKAKGMASFFVNAKHALRNAALPILTVAGLQFGILLGGAMITETIFSWPGMGSWILKSVENRDIPSIEAGVLVVATAFVIINFFVDILYQSFDPRVRV